MYTRVCVRACACACVYVVCVYCIYIYVCVCMCVCVSPRGGFREKMKRKEKGIEHGGRQQIWQNKGKSMRSRIKSCIAEGFLLVKYITKSPYWTLFFLYFFQIINTFRSIFSFEFIRLKVTPRWITMLLTAQLSQGKNDMVIDKSTLHFLTTFFFSYSNTQKPSITVSERNNICSLSLTFTHTFTHARTHT